MLVQLPVATPVTVCIHKLGWVHLQHCLRSSAHFVAACLLASCVTWQGLLCTHQQLCKSTAAYLRPSAQPAAAYVELAPGGRGMPCGSKSFVSVLAVWRLRDYYVGRGVLL